MRLGPGTVLGGKYKLVQALASGGMGCIWSARHATLNTQLAIKFILPTHAASDELRGRFELEAVASASISSAHVVHVSDYGVEDDTPYLVMDLLKGENLATRLKREKRLSLKATCKILIQVAKGLRRAHEAGIIHRDLKPANIFLAKDMDEEVVKILDFGIAKLASSNDIDRTLTGELVGSPLYMSPEQMLQSKDIDHRSDLWSLAVIVFRAITGVNPFAGDDSGFIMLSVLGDRIPVPSEIDPSLPPALDAFFLRAFERSPSKRYQSTREMADAFVEAALGEPPPASSWSVVGLCLGSNADATPIPQTAIPAPPSRTRFPDAPTKMDRPPTPDRAQPENTLRAAGSSTAPPRRRRAGGWISWRALGASALLSFGALWLFSQGSGSVVERWEQGVSTARKTGSSALRFLTEARDHIAADPTTHARQQNAALVSLTRPLDEPPSVPVQETVPASTRTPAPAPAFRPPVATLPH